jgi:hypothetical protein
MVECEVLCDPWKITLFCPDGVMLEPDEVAEPVEKRVALTFRTLRLRRRWLQGRINIDFFLGESEKDLIQGLFREWKAPIFSLRVPFVTGDGLDLADIIRVVRKCDLCAPRVVAIDTNPHCSPFV